MFVTAARIDEDVHRLIDDAHKQARDILTASRAQLDQVARALLQSETVYSQQLAQILGPQPSAPDLTPKEYAPDAKDLEKVAAGRDRAGSS